MYYLCCHPYRINCHEAYLLYAEHTTTCDANCHIRSHMAILPRAHQLHAHCLAQRLGCWKQTRGCSTKHHAHKAAHPQTKESLGWKLPAEHH